MQPNFLIENNFNYLCAGIDEAGRGPLAGPVVACCVILDKNNYPNEINDSKKISKNKRNIIFSQLLEFAKFGVGIVDEKTIDKINILEATKLAMQNAFLDLQNKYKIYPEVILVDGNFIPFAKCDKIIEILPIVKGDQKSLSIAAASIMAKVIRDNIMNDLDKKYPQYGFAKHKGYGTKLHLENITKFTPCDCHRKTFAPIKYFYND
jgi:ribonuclease HII